MDAGVVYVRAKETTGFGASCDVASSRVGGPSNRGSEARRKMDAFQYPKHDYGNGNNVPDVDLFRTEEAQKYEFCVEREFRGDECFVSITGRGKGGLACVTATSCGPDFINAFKLAAVSLADFIDCEYAELVYPVAQMDTDVGKPIDESSREGNTIVTTDAAVTSDNASNEVVKVMSEPDYEFKDIMNRWVPVGDLSIDGSFTEKVFDLPRGLYEAVGLTTNMLPFRSFVYSQPEIEVKIVVNGYKMCVGKLVASVLHDPFLLGGTLLSAKSGLQRQHVILDLSTNNEGVLRIPFRFHRAYLRNLKVKANSSTEVGLSSQLYVQSLSKFVSVDGNPGTITGRVYARFVSVNFNGMTYQENVAQMGKLTKLIRGVEDVMDVLPIPLDKPSDQTKTFIIPSGLAHFANGKGIVGAKPLRMNPTCLTSYKMIEPFDGDPSNAYELARKWGLRSVCKWTSNDEVGKQLCSILLDPTVRKYDGDVDAVLTPYEYAASIFNFWGGTTEFEFQFVSNMFHSGTIMISAEYGRTVDQKKLEEAAACYTKTFDLGEQKVVNFTAPYLYDTPMRRSNCAFWTHYNAQTPTDAGKDLAMAMGHKSFSRLRITVINKLVPVSSIPSEIEILVFMRGGEDVCFHSLKPREWKNKVKSEFQSVKPKAKAEMDVDPTANFQPGVSRKDIVTGDDQMDFYDILKRPTMMFSNVKIPNVEVDPESFFIPIMPLSRSFDSCSEVGFNANAVNSPAAAICDLFRFWRGSLRYTIMVRNPKGFLYATLVPHTGVKLIGSKKLNDIDWKESYAHGLGVFTEVGVLSVNSVLEVECPYDSENPWSLVWPYGDPNSRLRDAGDFNSGHLILTTTEKDTYADIWVSAGDDFALGNFIGVYELNYNRWNYIWYDNDVRAQALEGEDHHEFESGIIITLPIDKHAIVPRDVWTRFSTKEKSHYVVHYMMKHSSALQEVWPENDIAIARHERCSYWDKKLELYVIQAWNVDRKMTQYFAWDLKLKRCVWKPLPGKFVLVEKGHFGVRKNPLNYAVAQGADERDPSVYRDCVNISRPVFKNKRPKPTLMDNLRTNAAEYMEPPKRPIDSLAGAVLASVPAVAGGVGGVIASTIRTVQAAGSVKSCADSVRDLVDDVSADVADTIQNVNSVTGQVDQALPEVREAIAEVRGVVAQVGGDVSGAASAVTGAIESIMSALQPMIDSVTGCCTSVFRAAAVGYPCVQSWTRLIQDALLDILVGYSTQSYLAAATGMFRFICNLFNVDITTYMGLIASAADCMRLWFTAGATAQAVDTSLASKYVGILVSGIFSIVGLKGLAFENCPTLKKAGMFAGIFSGASAIFLFITRTFDVILDTVKWVFGYMSPEARALQALHLERASIEEFLVSAREVTCEVNSRMRRSPLHRRKVWKTVMQASRYKKLIAMSPASVNNTSLFKICEEVLKKTNECVSEYACAPVRYEPLVLMLEGQPGVGKSTVCPEIINSILDCMNFSSRGHDIVYTRSPASKYWDGYTDQPVILYDDWLNMKDTESVQQVVGEMYMLKTIADFMPNMASIEEKKIKGNPLLVVQLSNDAFPTEPINRVSSNSAAVLRRRDYVVRVELSEEAVGLIDAAPETLSYSEKMSSTVEILVKKYPAMINPHLRFMYYKNSFTKDLTGSYMTYSEFLDDITKRAKRYHDRALSNYRARYAEFCKQLLNPDEAIVGISDPFEAMYGIQENIATATPRSKQNFVEFLDHILENQSDDTCMLPAPSEPKAEAFSLLDGFMCLTALTSDYVAKFINAGVEGWVDISTRYINSLTDDVKGKCSKCCAETDMVTACDRRRHFFCEKCSLLFRGRCSTECGSIGMYRVVSRKQGWIDILIRYLLKGSRSIATSYLAVINVLKEKVSFNVSWLLPAAIAAYQGKIAWMAASAAGALIVAPDQKFGPFERATNYGLRVGYLNHPDAPTPGRHEGHIIVEEKRKMVLEEVEKGTKKAFTDSDCWLFKGREKLLSARAAEMYNAQKTKTKEVDPDEELGYVRRVFGGKPILDDDNTMQETVSRKKVDPGNPGTPCAVAQGNEVEDPEDDEFEMPTGPLGPEVNEAEIHKVTARTATDLVCLHKYLYDQRKSVTYHSDGDVYKWKVSVPNGARCVPTMVGMQACAATGCPMAEVDNVRTFCTDHLAVLRGNYTAGVLAIYESGGNLDDVKKVPPVFLPEWARKVEVNTPEDWWTYIKGSLAYLGKGILVLAGLTAGLAMVWKYVSVYSWLATPRAQDDSPGVDRTESKKHLSRFANLRKPTFDKHANSQSANNSEATVDKIVANQMVMRLMNGSEHAVDVACLGICGDKAIFPKHYYVSIQAAAARESEIYLIPGKRFTNRVGVHCVPYAFDANDFTMVPGVDLCVYTCPRSYPMFIDIRRYFARTADLCDKPLSSFAHFVKCPSMKANTPTTSEIEIEGFSESFPYSGTRGESLSCTDVITYNISGSGLCGSMVVCNNMERPIVAMHIAGNSVRTGYGMIITSEMLDKLVHPVVAEMEKFAVNPLEEGNRMRWDDVRIDVLGQVEVSEANFQPSNSKIVKSLIYDMLPEKTDMEPAILSKKDPRYMHEATPLHDGVRKHGIVTRDFRITDVVAARHALWSGWYSSMKPLIVDPHKLTVKEAICGFDIEYYDGLKLDTSSGYPWNKAVSGPSKSSWITPIRDANQKMVDCTVAAELTKELERKEGLRKIGIVPATIFADTLKDEKRPRAKLMKKGGTRVVCMSPVDFTIAARQSLLHFSAAMMKARYSVMSAVGVNVHSGEWYTIAHNLSQKSPNNIIEMDYSNFGPGFNSVVAAQAAELIIDWTMQYVKGVDRQELECIFAECVSSLHIAGQTVYRQSAGSPSGTAITTIFNSVVNQMYVMVAWKKITGESYAEFRRHVCLYVYGDDLIMSVTDKYRDVWNMQVLVNWFAQYGIAATPAEKTAEVPRFKRVETCSFLKRNFAPHPVRPMSMLAPLKWDVILAMTQYIRQGQPRKEATIDNILAALQEAHGHGVEKYERFKTQLVRACANSGLPGPLTSWQEIDNIWADGKLFCDDYWPEF